MVREARPATFPDRTWFEAWQDAVAKDRELAVVGRWCTLGFALRVGEEIFLVRLREGKIEEVVTETDINDSWSFTLAGSPEDWTAFLQEIPPPFYNDLLAMNSRVPTFSVEGDRHAFVRHLRTITRIFRIAQTLEARIA
ncbi:hypothetical protein BH24ACT20_BH24ACT20_05110 [soil metagenome]|jgi:hypothetical protein